MDKIIFTDEEIEKCIEFSELVDTSLYAKRKQWDAVKRKVDSKVGKLAEVAVYRTLVGKFSDITYPDFNIYKPREKSWDYDLKSSDFNLHVKSQNKIQSGRFGKSWVFEKTDKHIFIDYNDNDYVAFVQVDLLNNSATIEKVLSVNLLHKNRLFKPLILKHLNTKLAIYFEDVKEIENELNYI